MVALRTLRDAATSRTTVAVFGFLALSNLLPQVVDIYASPVYRLLFLPSYLVTMVLYDGGLGLENLVYPVYPVAESVLGDGYPLWEAGRFVTFYLFAVAVGWVVRTVRSRGPPRNRPSGDSDPTR